MNCIVITGAAGFIGANLLRGLNARGIKEIIAVDNLKNADKFINLNGGQISDYIDKEDFIDRLQNGYYDGAVDVVLHQGACSDTMGADGRYMMDNNYRYSRILLDWCVEQDVQFLYASSAAVYGSGQHGFSEQPECESPLNVYGYSKLLFDQVVRQYLAEGATTQIAGFRYFNVYGPHEGHKGRMASVALHNFHEYRHSGKVKLFEGSHGYGNGEQLRDFVYIDDVVQANLYFLDHPEISGVFNLGTGNAESFNAVASAVVNTCQGGEPRQLTDLQKDELIEYVPFPEALRGKYQAYTQADMQKISAVGFDKPFATVAEGVSCYVNWLQENSA